MEFIGQALGVIIGIVFLFSAGRIDGTRSKR
jgi:hypothetical protein